MSKEMRSMNIEKDNILWQYGHPHREFKETDTWNTQINKMRKNCMEDYYSKTKSLATYTKHYLEDVI